jgi:PAS domain-containing protein
MARVTALRDVTEQLRAEEARRESEKRYRGVVDLSPIGIWWLAGRHLPDGQRCHGAAPRIRARRAAARPEWPRDVFHDAQDRERLLARYGEARQTQDFEVRLKRRDGTPFWAQLSAHAIRDDQGGSCATRRSSATSPSARRRRRAARLGGALPPAVREQPAAHAGLRPPASPAWLAANEAAVRRTATRWTSCCA